MLKIKKSEFTQNIIKMFSGVALAQLITVIGSLILARLYSPEQFGELSIFISIVSILSILATVRYESTLIIIKQNRLARHMLSFLHWSSFTFAVILSLILFFFSHNALIYLKINAYYAYMPIGILIYTLFQISTNLNVRQKSFGNIAKSKVLMASVALFFQVIFYYSNAHLGLIYGYMLGYFMAVLILYSNISNPFSFEFNKLSTMALLSKYSYFLKHALPAEFINNFATNISPILIAAWFDVRVAGLYFLGYRIVNLPLQLISASVGKVYFQKVSHLYHKDKTKIYSFTKKIVYVLFIIIIIPLVVLFFYASEIIVFILGVEWKEAGIYISILSVMFLFRTLFSPISSIAEVTKKMNIILYFSIYILIVTLLSFYIGYIGHSFMLAIWLLSASVSFGYASVLIYFLQHLKGFKYES